MPWKCTWGEQCTAVSHLVSTPLAAPAAEQVRLGFLCSEDTPNQLTDPKLSLTTAIYLAVTLCAAGLSSAETSLLRAHQPSLRILPSLQPAASSCSPGGAESANRIFPGPSPISASHSGPSNKNKPSARLQVLGSVGQGDARTQPLSSIG